MVSLDRCRRPSSHHCRPPGLHCRPPGLRCRCSRHHSYPPSLCPPGQIGACRVRPRVFELAKTTGGKCTISAA